MGILPPVADDFDLLDAWGNGDAKAGSALFNRHFRAVYGFFRNKVDDGADDLVQQTYLRCVETRERFERKSSFRTYLFGTARNVLFEDFRRRRRDSTEPDFEHESVVDLTPSPSRIMVEKADRRVLLEALRRIPLDYQIALELYHWESLTGPELGVILGLSEPGVRSRLRRANEALRERIEAIESCPEKLRSTLAGLSAWARELREYVQADARA